ncbi:hypothetical protein PWT90_00263 [Aphanocladium album]|nr:hypothetical protein PWT90_00263 [Aphanocladium album]
MTGTAPTTPRRRSFLGRFFGKKDKNEPSSDATPPPYKNTAQDHLPANQTINQQDSTPRTHLKEAEDYFKEEEAKLKTGPHEAGGSLSGNKDNRTKNYIHEEENAAQTETKNIEADWREAQESESSEDKYGDLM